MSLSWTSLFGHFFDSLRGESDSPRRGWLALPPAPEARSNALELAVPLSVAAWEPPRVEAPPPEGLDDGAIKLVKYGMVSIRRCHERILAGGLGEMLVTTRMTSESFSVWMIARYLQSEEYRAAVAEDRRNEILREEKKFLR